MDSSSSTNDESRNEDEKPLWIKKLQELDDFSEDDVDELAGENASFDSMSEASVLGDSNALVPLQEDSNDEKSRDFTAPKDDVDFATDEQGKFETDLRVQSSGFSLFTKLVVFVLVIFTIVKAGQVLFPVPSMTRSLERYPRFKVTEATSEKEKMDLAEKIFVVFQKRISGQMEISEKHRKDEDGRLKRSAYNAIVNEIDGFVKEINSCLSLKCGQYMSDEFRSWLNDFDERTVKFINSTNQKMMDFN